jgi:hypothetical protein
MPKGFKVGWAVVLIGVVLILSMPLLHVTRRAPEIQHDRDEMWEYDAAEWRQAVVFFVGCGVVAVGVYVLRNYGKT